MRPLSGKEQGELNFWIDHVHGGGCKRVLGRDYIDQWSDGAKGRLAFFKEQVVEMNKVVGGVWADVGCGPYPVLLHAPESTTAIMIDPLMKHYFHQRLLPPNAAGPRRVFIESFIESLPLPDCTVDVLMCLNCLDHVDDPWMGLTELTRVIKVGGFLVLDVDIGGEADYMHPQTITESRLEQKLAELGLTRLKYYRNADGKRVGAAQYYAFYQRTEINKSVFVEPEPYNRSLFVPTLVREGVKGYNIIHLPDGYGKGSYFAVHQSEGPFYYNKAVAGAYKLCIESADFDSLIAQLEA